jgi:hypothetical protein
MGHGSPALQNYQYQRNYGSRNHVFPFLSRDLYARKYERVGEEPSPLLTRAQKDNADGKLLGFSVSELQ